jgi:hypothetical protein
MPASAPYRKKSLANLLGYGENERQFLGDLISGAEDISGRGVIAPLLGMAGDLGGAANSAGVWANNKIKDLEYATGMLKPDMASLITGKRKGYLKQDDAIPYGGSEHIGRLMQDKGLVSATRRPKTELLASLISPGAAAKTVLNAGKSAKQLLNIADNAATMGDFQRGRKMGQLGAIDVWHGSPHKFEKFSAMDNVGKGEGAQAYGHGGYHASSPAVAGGYRDALTPEIRSLTGYAGPDRAKNAASMLTSNIPESDIVEGLIALGDESPMESIAAGKSLIAEAKSAGNLYRNQLRWPDPAREAADPLSDKHFLDWDKPLSEQSPEVQQVINGLGERYQVSDGQTTKFQQFPESFTGSDLYKRLGISERYNSKELADIGIPGIRYLDGGSRSAGAGTHNYVTFDDNLVNILERNGQPVTAPQPGLLGKMVAPQDEALRVAQQNAALPVEQGGLGLHPNNTPEERAAAMGFTTEGYHGTNADVPEFLPNNSLGGSIFTAPTPDGANPFAYSRGANCS